MLTSPNGAAAKKDLHVGGVGAGAAPPAEQSSGTFGALIDPLVDASEAWVRRARDFIGHADDYVRGNPWAAVGVGAMLGLTLGYFLSRSARRRN
ncbi:MAG TPA: hypothetical protein VME42_16170 [Steroidobacteraceae bacterium]|nr:hypothetical protein [Steroidobacteraceae bacterium]